MERLDRWVAVVLVSSILGAGACSEETRERAKQKLDQVLEHTSDAREARADTPPPEPALDVPGRGFAAGTYQITEVRIVLRPDATYDKDSEPDPTIDVRVDGQSVGSCHQDETRALACRLRWATFELDRSTEISLAVVDADSVTKDKIGTASLDRLTERGAAGTPLPMHVTGGLAEAAVIVGAPPPVSRLQVRVFGGLAGVALALVLLAMFHRYLFDENRYLVGRQVASRRAARSQQPDADPGVAVKVRCPFCAALNDETDATCGKCGGTL